MKFCDKCGNQLEDDVKFCNKCGATINAENVNSQPGFNVPPQNNYNYIPQQNYYAPRPNYNAPAPVETEKVTSIWAFIGSIFLFNIPLAGLIVQICWACGAIKNKNLRNFARAYLIFDAIVIVLSVIIGIAFAGVIYSMFMNGQSYYGYSVPRYW